MAELKTSLVLDSNAVQQLADIKRALADVGGESKKTESTLGKIGIQGAGEFVGHMAERGAEKLFEMFQEVAHKGAEILSEGFSAALGELAGRRELASALSMSASGAGFDELSDRAIVFKDQLEDIGTQAGVSDDTLGQVFADLAARSGKAGDQVLELTEQIAMAGKAIPGGAAALGEGLANMELGMIKAKNPLVQMIAATGELHGNATQVAKQLKKMTPEDAMAVGEKAIAKMAARMKDVPLTFDQAVVSLKGLKEQMLESLGLPMVAAVQPVLNELTAALIENKDAIQNAMTGLGEEVSAGFKDAIKDAKEIYEYFSKSSKELKEGASDIYTMYKANIVALWEIGKALVTALGWVGIAFEKIKDKVLGMASEGSFGNEIQRLEKRHELKGQRAEVEQVAKGAADPREFAKLEASLAKFNETALLARTPDQAFAAQEKGVAEAERRKGSQIEATEHNMNARRFGELYEIAGKDHDEALQKYAAHVLASSEKFQDALIQGGFLKDQLSGLVGKMRDNPEDKAAADVFAKKVMAGKASEKAVNNVNISNATFHIKQDFRDQDPDRVLVAFRKDIAKSAVARLQSSRAYGQGF